MKRLVVLAVTVLTLAFSQARVDAAFDFAFTGNSWFDDGGNSGWVSYAAYRNPKGSNWITDLGAAGLPALGAQVPFGPTATGLEGAVVFFQVTAFTGGATTFTLDPAAPINVASGVADFNTGPDPWVGFAHFDAGPLAGIAFDDGAVVDDFANPTLGAAAAMAAPAPTGTVATPALRSLLSNSLFGGPVMFTPNPGIAGSGSISSAGTGGFTFTPPAIPGPVGFTSPVFALTASTFAPTFFYGVGNITGPGGADVLLPLVNPEPGTFALLAIGLAGGGVVYRRKRTKAAK